MWVPNDFTVFLRITAVTIMVETLLGQRMSELKLNGYADIRHPMVHKVNSTGDKCFDHATTAFHRYNYCKKINIPRAKALSTDASFTVV